MVDSDFLKKICDESASGNRTPRNDDSIHPSDLEIPRTMMGNIYARILDVPMHVGSTVREVYLFGKEHAKQSGKDEWMAMPYAKDGELETYLSKIGWFNGPVTIITPPCPGIFVVLTTKGFEELINHFPSDSYKKRMICQKR